MNTNLCQLQEATSSAPSAPRKVNAQVNAASHPQYEAKQSVVYTEVSRLGRKQKQAGSVVLRQKQCMAERDAKCGQNAV